VHSRPVQSSRGARHRSGDGALFVLRSRRQGREEANELHSHTRQSAAMGGRWWRGPRKQLTQIIPSEAFAEDLPRFRARLERLRIDFGGGTPDPPPRLDIERYLAADPTRNRYSEIRVEETTSPDAKSVLRQCRGRPRVQSAPSRSQVHLGGRASSPTLLVFTAKFRRPYNFYSRGSGRRRRDRSG